MRKISREKTKIKGIQIIILNFEIYLVFNISGVFSDEDIPVPISNTEVKLISADGTKFCLGE